MAEISKNEIKYFQEVLDLIKTSRNNAFKRVNYELINLYWEIGAYLSEKCATLGWGNNIVENLSKFIQKTDPNSIGFSSPNLWRMKQFYETYSEDKKLSLLVREIGWTNNMIIVAQTKTKGEKEFYLKMTARENYTKKELQRQLDSGFYERAMLSKKNLSLVAREIYPSLYNHVKDYYSLEFLGLKDNYSENSFQKAILENLKEFILEFGKDFLFIQNEFRLQVGNRDYSVDLLFYHRGLNCLVALELKVGEFKPEYMGKMDFYLGALDKYVKKEHENPSVGIIMCRTKDDNVVEISLNRSTSPTVISQYETQLISKELLKAKLTELFENEDIKNKTQQTK